MGIKKESFNWNIVDEKPDKYQQEAIESESKSSLIIAGAGSGKTTTIIYRIIYLLAKNETIPNNLLILVFNKNVAQQIRDRLINISKNIKCSNLKKKIYDLATGKDKKTVHTYNSFGYQVINKKQKELNAKFYKINQELSYKNTNDLLPILKKLFDDKKITKLLLNYFIHKNEIKDIFVQIKNLKEYNDYIRPDKKTLLGEKVKSFEELEIANYLFLKGIKYKYEDIYKKTKGDVPYNPDFHIYGKTEEKKYDLYLEHFALNKNNKAPTYFKNPNEYVDNYYKKKERMKKDGEDLICTYSYQFTDQSIFDHIDSELKKRKINYSDTDIQEALKKLINPKNKTYKCHKVLELLGKATSLFKIKELSMKKLIEEHSCKAINLNEKTTSKIANLVFSILNFFLETTSYIKGYDNELKAFIEIFQKFYNEYQKELKKTNTIDFDDQIIKCKNILRKESKTNFNHVIVDEFQDISEPKADIIQSLQNNNKNLKLFFVGDDWQSINGFAGSNYKIMSKSEKFYKYFGSAKKFHIKYTYRFNDKVCKITKKFIEKNEDLIKKNLKSFHGEKKENKKWNEQIPIEIALLPSHTELNIGTNINHDVYGEGKIKKKESDGYIVDFKDEILKVDFKELELTDIILKKKIIEDIVKKIKSIKEKKINEIMFLTRLNHETYLDNIFFKYLIKSLEKEFNLKKIDTKKEGVLEFKSKIYNKISFRTIHKAKGLQADYIFLLKTYSSKQGFPHSKEDEALLIPFTAGTYSEDPIKEEERLFYVALTRSKNKTFIYADKENLFIKRIIKENKINNDYAISTIIQTKNDKFEDIEEEIKEEPESKCLECDAPLSKKNIKYSPKTEQEFYVCSECNKTQDLEKNIEAYCDRCSKPLSKRNLFKNSYDRSLFYKCFSCYKTQDAE